MKESFSIIILTKYKIHGETGEFPINAGKGFQDKIYVFHMYFDVI